MTRDQQQVRKKKRRVDGRGQGKKRSDKMKHRNGMDRSRVVLAESESIYGTKVFTIPASQTFDSTVLTRQSSGFKLKPKKSKKAKEQKEPKEGSSSSSKRLHNFDGLVAGNLPPVSNNKVWQLEEEEDHRHFDRSSVELQRSPKMAARGEATRVSTTLWSSPADSQRSASALGRLSSQDEARPDAASAERFDTADEEAAWGATDLDEHHGIRQACAQCNSVREEASKAIVAAAAAETAFTKRKWDLEVSYETQRLEDLECNLEDIQQHIVRATQTQDRSKNECTSRIQTMQENFDDRQRHMRSKCATLRSRLHDATLEVTHLRRKAARLEEATRS